MATSGARVAPTTCPSRRLPHRPSEIENCLVKHARWPTRSLPSPDETRGNIVKLSSCWHRDRRLARVSRESSARCAAVFSALRVSQGIEFIDALR